MKKNVLFMATIAVLGLASCGKEYSCYCEYNDGTDRGEEQFNSGTKRTKKKAEKDCSNNETELKFFYPNIECTVK